MKKYTFIVLAALTIILTTTCILAATFHVIPGQSIQDAIDSSTHGDTVAVHAGTGKDRKQVGIELHSGKNRIIRRMFEHLGYTVTKLDRVYFAGLTKKDLARGQWRFLTQTEVNLLQMNSNKE